MDVASTTHRGKQELRWLVVGSCMVAVIESKRVSDPLWAEWLAAVERPSVKTSVVCIQQAVQLSANQWRAWTSSIKNAGVRVAVVTDDRQTAAHAKKAAWLGADVQAFRSDLSFYDALLHLGLDFAQRKQVKPKLQELVESYGSKLAAPQASHRTMPAWMREEAPEARMQARKRPISSASPAAQTSRTTAPERSKRGELTAEFQRSRDAVFQSSSDIQAKLAEVQARLRARNLEMQRARG